MRRAEPGQAQARTPDNSPETSEAEVGGDSGEALRLFAMTSLGLSYRHAPQYLRGGKDVAYWPNSDLSGMSAEWSLCGKTDVERAARHPQFMSIRP